MPLLTQDEIAKEIAEGVHQKHNYNEMIRERSTDAALFAAHSIQSSLAHKVRPQEIVRNTQSLIHTKVREIGAISELFPEQVELAQSIVVQMIYGIIEDLIKDNGTLDSIEERAEVMECLQAKGGQALLEEADAQPAGMVGEDDSSGDESDIDLVAAAKKARTVRRGNDGAQPDCDSESYDGSSSDDEFLLEKRGGNDLSCFAFKGERGDAQPLRKSGSQYEEDSRISTPLTPPPPPPALGDVVPEVELHLVVAHHEMHGIVEAIEVKLIGEGVCALVGKVDADPWAHLVDHF